MIEYKDKGQLDEETMVDRSGFPRPTKWLFHALIVSVTLNVAFLATLFSFVLKGEKGEVKRSCRELSHLPKGLEGTLSNYLGASFDELIDALEDETHIGQGQLACDLALACLVGCYHFDVKRALGGYQLQEREYAFEDKESKEWLSLTLFAGLNEDQRRALRHFAQVELFPLTAEGLFLEMREKGEHSPALRETFFLSKEFYAIERSFVHFIPSLSKEELLCFLLEGDWEMLSSLVADLTDHPEEKKERLILFCLEFFKKGIRKGGELLLEIDANFPFERFDDQELAILFPSFERLAPEVESFLSKIKKSLRSDQIREQADKTLRELSIKEEESPPLEERITYVVQFGDTLWKISREFGVSIREIRELNELKSDLLLPGEKLVIPR